jgi:hypothetical protein
VPGRRGELVAVSPSAVAYCRAARRLRGRLADRPARLHRALRELNLATTDSSSTPKPPAATTSPAGPAADFAAEVARRMDGPVLRQAQRRALLAYAARAGIGRFEANLIIAAVQHERRGESGLPQPTLPSSEPPRVTRAAPVLAALTLQGLIAWGAWRVWWG